MVTRELIKNNSEELSLFNISSDIMSYLKETSENKKEIKINNVFELDYFKEYVKQELMLYKLIYESLYKSRRSESPKADLYIKINKIIENDSLLERFAILKIQQFINELLKYVTNEEVNKNNEYVIKKDKLKDSKIKYKDTNISLDIPKKTKNIFEVREALYREFGLSTKQDRHLDRFLECKFSDEYTTAQKKYADKQLFKSGFDYKDDRLVFDFPFKDNDGVFGVLMSYYVPNQENSNNKETKNEEKITIKLPLSDREIIQRKKIREKRKNNVISFADYINRMR